MSSLLINVSALIGQGLAYSKLYFYQVCCLFSLPSLWREIKTQKPLNYIRMYPVFILALYMATSLIWSDHKAAGVIEILQFTLGIYLLFYNKTVGIRKSVLERAIVWLMIINLTISFGEALGLFRYPLSQYSELAALFKRNAYDWFPLKTDVPTGLHWNPNNNAFFILIFSPIVISLLKTWQKFLYYCICSFIFYKTGSKLLLIGWIFFSVLIGLHFLRHSKLGSKKMFYISLGMIGLTGLFFRFTDNSFQLDRYSKILPSLSYYVVLVPNMAYQRFTGQNVTFNVMAKDSSLHERLTMMDGIFKVISQHPFLGVGAGDLNSMYHEQGPSKLPLSTPHFYLLENWAKYGIFFILIYLMWILFLVKINWQEKNVVWMSLILFLLFSPVVATLSYFLPKWVLYSYALNDSES